MLTDYKFQNIRRDGQTTKCRVAFYEGDITTEREVDASGIPMDVTRYRRTKLLRVQDFGFQGDLSDTELRRRINPELKKDTARSPIKEQINAEDIRATI